MSVDRRVTAAIRALFVGQRFDPAEEVHVVVIPPAADCAPQVSRGR